MNSSVLSPLLIWSADMSPRLPNAKALFLCFCRDDEAPWFCRFPALAKLYAFVRYDELTFDEKFSFDDRLNTYEELMIF